MNVDAVRKRIRRGTLDAYKAGDRWYVVLPGVQDAASSPAGSPVQDAVQATGEPIEAAYRVTPAEIEQAVSRTAQQYAGDMATVFDRVSVLYEAQLLAKDQTIATQAETIAELRRRAEVAEAEASTLRAQRAPQEAPAATEVVPRPVNADDTRSGRWASVRRWWRGEG